MKAILNDVTRCEGCMRCVQACVVRNGGDPEFTLTGHDRLGLSAKRLTAIEMTPEGRFLRRQCHHCMDPSCVGACLVGALTKSPEGPVVYDFDKCMGCRYCMLACPFQVPRYEWDQSSPRMRKCSMCHDHPGGPACVTACPNGATLFGERDELLEVARERIRKHPELYIDRVWGETDAGGTGVLFLSDVSLDAYWPAGLDGHSVSEITWPFVTKTPWLALTVAGTLSAFSWMIRRRNRLAEERAGKETQ